MALKKVWEDVITGKAYYFRPQHLQVFNGDTEKARYEILLEIDKETAKTLKAHNAKITRDKVVKDSEGNDIELDYSVKFKSKFPIKVIDAAKNSLDLDISSKRIFIGNGSTVKVDAYVYSASPSNGGGCNLVQLLNLIESKDTGSGSEDPEVTLSKFDVEGEGIADITLTANSELDSEVTDDEIPF